MMKMKCSSSVLLLQVLALNLDDLQDTISFKKSRELSLLARGPILHILPCAFKSKFSGVLESI